jgi:Tfp pilus assembly protein PilE
VVAIIAILAAIAIPIYLGQQDNARNSAVQGALQTVQQQVSSKTVGDNGEAVAVNQTTLNSIISDAGYDPASSKKVQITGTVTGTGAATTYTLTGTYGNATDNKFTIDQNGKIS